MSRTIFGAMLPALLLAGTFGTAQGSGKFVAMWWDGATEHFVSVDPHTGSHTSVASIPDVEAVQMNAFYFDVNRGHYVFSGGEMRGPLRYQTLNVHTGAVVSISVKVDNLKGLIFDADIDRIYGTWWKDSSWYDTIQPADPPRPAMTRHVLSGREYFSSIDAATGTRIDTEIPGLKFIRVSSHFLDTDNGRYVLEGTDTAGVRAYYVIDVETGAVTAMIPVDMKLDNPVYNPDLGAVHALWWSDSSWYDTIPIPGTDLVRTHRILAGTEYFVTVWPDSTMTMVPVPDLRYIVNMTYAFDPDEGHYVFLGREASGPVRYYVIDVATGAVLSNAEAAGNVKNLVYVPGEAAPSTPPPGKQSEEGITGLRPAEGWVLRVPPRAGHAVLEFDNPAGERHAFRLHDLSGRTVLRMDDIRTGSVRIETSGLKTGTYVFGLRGARGLVASGKLAVD
jgi:hypothetical protein